jgi:hypothetical protein
MCLATGLELCFLISPVCVVRVSCVCRVCRAQLRDVVILDPQWLMDVMSTVVSTKHNYCRYVTYLTM